MISKTLFTQSVQCQKLAYVSQNASERFKEDSLGVQFRKKQGTLVGEFAKKLYPEGIDMARMHDDVKIHQTQEHKDKVLFEASAKYQDLFARADILIPNHDNTYTIIEVKADTSIKPEHIPDVSFQKYVFEQAGFLIKEVKIAHPNNEYVKQGDINPQEFFIIEDVTDKLIQVEPLIDKLRNTLTQQEPNVPIGRYCTKPFDCPLKKECWKFLPQNNVTQLYFDKKTGFELIPQGILEIKDIPDTHVPSGRGKTQREIQIKATKNNLIHIDKKNIQKWLDTLKYPFYYFDFETYAPAIPIFDNARSWQRIPFQYSVHIEQEDGTLTHKEFLATTKNDPRIPLIEQMITDVGTTGSIIVFNQTFEKSIINELIRDYPQYTDQLNAIYNRIVDLADPFEKFYYYNPQQMGRYSIKVILPLLTELSYKGMEVGDGEDAFCAYEDMLNGKLEKVEALKEYCKLDTLAEVEIIKRLKFLIH